MVLPIAATCETCHSTALVTDYVSGEIVCGDCGQVQAIVLSHEPEHKWHDEEERKSRDRAGDPFSMSTISILGLPSSMFIPNTDHAGSALEMHRQKQWRRLLNHQKGAKTSQKRHFSMVLAEIKQICHQLQLPETVVQDVLILYAKASKRGLLRGRSKSQVILALVYIIATKKGMYLDLKDVETTWNIKPRKIRKLVEMLGNVLKIDVKTASINLTPKQMIFKIGAELTLDPRIIQKASKIYAVAKKNDNNHILSGKRPSSIAAACLYLAIQSQKERTTPETIARKMGVGKLTIRKHSRRIIQIVQRSRQDHLILAM